MWFEFMKKTLLLTLFLSCVLLLCSKSINTVGEIKSWSVEYTLVDNSSDTDDHDIDGTSTEAVLYVTSCFSEYKLTFIENNIENLPITSGFIRAPPQNLV